MPVDRAHVYDIRLPVWECLTHLPRLTCDCIRTQCESKACTVVFASMKILSRWTGINVETRYFDKVFSKQQSPCVVICNHQSALDTIVMAHAYPPRGTVMMKRSLAYVPIFNITAWLCSVIFVDRFNREKAMKAVEQCTQVMNKKNLKLWVFPEGTRNRSLDGMLPFKKGAFNVAVQGQIPIVPVVASSYKCFYSHNEHYFDNDGEIIIEIMDPIPTTGLTLDDVPALADEVREKMLVVYERITKEVNEKITLKRGGKKHE
ncbi:acl-2 [Pristionchus pacificus]|uniref:1-acyl-sn-glycerol-3-phosphate acyltransferase n=1 Tax=Pristionchus pacificus TaxID=54126 RepID=A0A2A6CRI7_PRIPA|nr:acl-2 [Pristionchus pacificus]|eukprot:PDM80641.1 acl-2 [Pristionchus pacificus]